MFGYYLIDEVFMLYAEYSIYQKYIFYFLGNFRGETGMPGNVFWFEDKFAALKNLILGITLFE